MKEGTCYIKRSEARRGELFLVETEQKQIPRADYSKVFK